MGYYTRYELDVEEGDDSVIPEFRKEYQEAAFALGEDGEGGDDCKWYSHEKDLREFSKKHPDTVFCLYGKGEEGDEWNLYIKNGKGHICEAVVTFPPYDEKLLK